MKKFISMVLVVISCLSFVACGSAKEDVWVSDGSAKATTDTKTVYECMLGNNYAFVSGDMCLVVEVDKKGNCNLNYIQGLAHEEEEGELTIEKGIVCLDSDSADLHTSFEYYYISEDGGECAFIDSERGLLLLDDELYSDLVYWK